MKKLTVAQMLKIKEIDEKIETLRELKNSVISRILIKNGNSLCTGTTKVEGLEKPWMRVTLTFNDAPFSEKDIIYRVAAFAKYESKVEFLKNEPKE